MATPTLRQARSKPSLISIAGKLFCLVTLTSVGMPVIGVEAAALLVALLEDALADRL